MKDKNIKRVFDQIQTDESMKARMLENIYKGYNQESNENVDNKVVQFKSKKSIHKKSISVLAASIMLVCGALINNNRLSSNKYINSGQEFQEVVEEELSGNGIIDKIETTQEGTIITVGDIKILVTASTNILKGESVLKISDLKEGQNVEVYSDGVQGDILNGLRIEVIN